jgi:phosphoribosyl-ATP pyrophosphohydrolase
MKAEFTTTWVAFREQAVERSRLDRIGPEGDPARLAYLALGLCGEAGECVFAMTDGTREEFISEAGDVAWYLAMTERESGVGIEWRVLARRESVRGATWKLMHAACAAAECIKRPVQRRDLPREALALALTGVAASLLAVLRLAGCTIEEALAANVAKNHKRFGAEGFSVEAQRAHDAALHAGGAR